MGCSSSSLNDLPAVALCRDRCNYIDEALRQSYALADAHVAYLESLKSLGSTLHSFFGQNPNPPTIVDPAKTTLPVASPDHSHSSYNSESHLRFHSDSEDEDSTDDKDLESSLLHHDENLSQIPYNFTFMNSRKPPPPPSPITPAWDLFNFFDTYERFDRFYISNSEGEAPAEKTKFDGDEKLSGNISAKKKVEEKGQSKPSVKAEDSDTKKKEGVMDKGDGPKKEGSKSEKVSDSTAPSGKRAVTEAMSEIQVLFEKASESGIDILKLLNYRQRINLKKDYVCLGFDEEVGMSSPNLSSTLKKLVLWEKKLYDEVKAEEKLRIIHERKCQQLKHLVKKGADHAHRANTTRILLANLSTKLKIAFQVVDRISVAINNLRDQELWPQIKELNHRLLPMWKAMLECHRCQHQIVAEAKGLDAITAYNGKLTYADLEAIIQVKLELQNWMLGFSNWIVIQKDYVKSMNGWLMRCLLYEPEETADGIVPFSPGRVGAPPVFVIFNHWKQAMDKLAETQVIGAVQGFVAAIDMLLEQHNMELQQMLIADKDIERKVKFLEKEEQKIHKVMQSREEKSMVLLAEKINIRCEITKSSSNELQLGLKQVFMSLEKFVANSIQVYEELDVRIEELRHAEVDVSVA
ncbi:hypothetical protein FNV43_RR12057 [Rhamnella rubrinervis]|uniref:Nitrate regulatory gene2 protein-like n=1 Tax=Rhamnella rubrinervis TaxID=2594499 RepID=A0A8K0H6V2_9ROSA|nr:hypothetical protein FNV43_RR12057 [Rhamnella rubrinervis]